MCMSLFISSITMAGEEPASSPELSKQGYLGTPMEIPKPLEIRLDVQITMFLAELFDLQWRPAIAEEESMIAEMNRKD